MKELWVGEQIGVMRYVWVKEENGGVRNFQIRSFDLTTFIQIMEEFGIKAEEYDKEKWIEQKLKSKDC